jgi:molybdopterin molybdotransferase
MFDLDPARGQGGTHLDRVEGKTMGKQSSMMISVEEALERILPHFHVLESEAVDILDSLDRVLADDVYSDINIPPFANSAMDGYAVRSQDVKGASCEHPVDLRVVGNLAAGYTSDLVVEAGTAMRIMTGAPLPKGSDAVVRFEDTSEGSDGGKWGRESGGARIRVLAEVKPDDNVRPLGEDVRSGELVLAKSTVVRAADIGVLASLGRSRVRVIRRPRVAILATGDELLTIDEPLVSGKIRNSNEYSIAALVLRYGGVPVRLGIARDNIDDLTAKVREGIARKVDLFLTSAGVSVGDYDVVKDVLNREGKMHFWQVRMKPGKPLAFGVVEGIPLMGLPGNPVSSMVSFEQFARPAILKMQGKTRLVKPTVEAVLEDDVENSGRRGYIRVILTRKGQEWSARVTGGQGSGVLTSMAKADGLAIIPEEIRLARAGDRVKVQVLDWSEQE